MKKQAINYLARDLCFWVFYGSHCPPLATNVRRRPPIAICLTTNVNQYPNCRYMTLFVVSFNIDRSIFRP